MTNTTIQLTKVRQLIEAVKAYIVHYNAGYSDDWQRESQLVDDLEQALKEVEE